jgi:hypothetical protein
VTRARSSEGVDTIDRHLRGDKTDGLNAQAIDTAPGLSASKGALWT